MPVSWRLRSAAPTRPRRPRNRSRAPVASGEERKALSTRRAWARIRSLSSSERRAPSIWATSTASRRAAASFG